MCLFGSAWAQIQVPAETPPHVPIVATCAMPLVGEPQFTWSASPNASLIVSADGKTAHIWAPPGEHRLEVLALSIDWDNRRSEFKKYQATFTVVGVNPTPVPPKPDPTPPGVLGQLVQSPSDREKLAAFYRDLAAVVRTTTELKTTGQFRNAQQISARALKQSAGLPDIPGLNGPISDRIAKAIGVDDVQMDAAKREALAKALEGIAKDF
jgi:hypothetical protein